MSDNGKSFFKADKANRNAAFHFLQGDGEGARDGDQGAYVHPLPANLGIAQKVSNPLLEPAPENPTLETTGRIDGDSVAYYDRVSGVNNK